MEEEEDEEEEPSPAMLARDGTVHMCRPARLLSSSPVFQPCIHIIPLHFVLKRLPSIHSPQIFFPK